MNQHETMVASIHVLQNGEMKQAEVNGAAVLLTRIDG